MIFDSYGIELIPGNFGQDCPGNGEHHDENGELIEICCDECNYFLCCTDEQYYIRCADCEDENCTRNKK